MNCCGSDSHQSLTIKTWVHSQTSPSRICGRQSGTGTCFSWSTLVFSCHHHSPVLHNKLWKEVPDHVYVFCAYRLYFADKDICFFSSISDCCISFLRFNWYCLLYSDFLCLLSASSVSEDVEAYCCISILHFNRYHLFLSALFCFLIALISVSAILIL